MCSPAICKDSLLLLQVHTQRAGHKVECEGGCVRVRYAELWGIHRCCTPRGSWVGFLIWSTKLLVGIVSLWYILFWALAAVFPTSHCPSVMQFSTQYSGWGEKEVGLFGSIPHPGEARYSHTLTILHGRNHGPRSLCWHWAVIPWRKGDANKVKLLLLSSGMHAF